MGQGDDGLIQGTFQVLKAFASIVECRDPYSRGHGERAAFLGRELARELGLTEGFQRDIQMAGLVHDIGKLSAEAGTLLKPGPLNLAEWLEVRRHPGKGAEMLRSIGLFQGLIPVVESHHEHYDGTGYPWGLRREQIPLGGRILAVADAYDALNSQRSYRPRFSHGDALRILGEGAGAQWDTKVVEALLRLASGVGG